MANFQAATNLVAAAPALAPATPPSTTIAAALTAINNDHSSLGSSVGVAGYIATAIAKIQGQAAAISNTSDPTYIAYMDQITTLQNISGMILPIANDLSTQSSAIQNAASMMQAQATVAALQQPAPAASYTPYAVGGAVGLVGGGVTAWLIMKYLASKKAV